jgi:hypothetical protein
MAVVFAAVLKKTGHLWAVKRSIDFLFRVPQICRIINALCLMIFIILLVASFNLQANNGLAGIVYVCIRTIVFIIAAIAISIDLYVSGYLRRIYITAKDFSKSCNGHKRNNTLPESERWSLNNTIIGYVAAKEAFRSHHTVRDPRTAADYTETKENVDKLMVKVSETNSYYQPYLLSGKDALVPIVYAIAISAISCI